VDQWDAQGRKIQRVADRSEKADFINQALNLMGVRHYVLTGKQGAVSLEP